MTSLQVRLFGRPEIRGAEDFSKQLGGKTVGRLLALLCIHADRDMDRRRLTEMLWPHEPHVPLNRLAVSLYHLKQLIRSTGINPSPILITTRDSIRLNPARLQIDLGEFLNVISRARNTESAASRRRAYTQAVDLYQAPFLEGMEETWAAPMRLKTQTDYQEAVVWLADDALNSGSEQRAQQILTNAILRDPTSIPSCETIIVWMAEHGRLSSAIEAVEAIMFAISSLGQRPPRRLFELSQSWKGRLNTLSRSEQLVCILAADNIRQMSFAKVIAGYDGRHGRNADFALFPAPASALAAASEMLRISRESRVVISLAVMDAADPLPATIRPVLRGLPKGSLFCSDTVKPLLAETTDAVIMTATVVEKWHEVRYSDSPPA